VDGIALLAQLFDASSAAEELPESAWLRIGAD
jgi:hypothetical protein